MNNKKIFDAHTHFNDDWKYKEEMIDRLVKEAQQENVGGFLCASFDLISSYKSVELAKKYKDIIYSAIAIHPNDVTKHKLSVFDKLDKLCENTEVVCIGETGLDYFYTKEDKQLQKEFFIKHIELANKHNKVLQIHIRDEVDVYDAYLDVIDILKKYQVAKIIIHCFSANKEIADKFLALGCYLNIGGAVTFKNARTLQEATIHIPLDKMLVETDAPYLTPHPHRGTLNEPKFINLTVEKIAELKNLRKEEVIKATTNNAIKLFDLNK
ncbi:Mg-dependent DNase [Entomoplasma ellychniae]|uniref:Mg-dependent DNase n=1 Tax=Entomoplasma ellychniae TaxID=2114 RepID=A0A8E2QW93_9MOLU|nr:TatD family hydrolase [Entomoplasma ellychniae]PPE04836.1 Mg-dependent DNase [Entomoplasma ellychniae]